MTAIQDINQDAKDLGAAKALIVGHDGNGNAIALKLNTDGTMSGGGGGGALPPLVGPHGP